MYFVAQHWADKNFSLANKFSCLRQNLQLGSTASFVFHLRELREETHRRDPGSPRALHTGMKVGPCSPDSKRAAATQTLWHWHERPEHLGGTFRGAGPSVGVPLCSLL